MRRFLLGLGVGCAALVFALAVAWVSRDREFGDDVGWR
jgi:hypothetical protein